MNPARYDLPVVWRGSDYPAIILRWKTSDGTPVNLTGWMAHARSRHINFNPLILDAPNGVTSISLTNQETLVLPIGIERWDWLWAFQASPAFTGPFIAGYVEVKDPISANAQ